MPESSVHVPFEIVAVASSAGGMTALMRILSQLPSDFAIPMVVVQHLDPHHRSLLATILSRHTGLTVKEAQEGDRLHGGTAYIAPPDHHLLVKPDATLTLTRSEPVHFVRPSADLLFASVAAVFGRHAIAVVLSGTGVDGATGVKAIEQHGGIVIAQDQQSSEYFGMPGAAIQTGCVDFVLPLDEIAPTLVTLEMENNAKNSP